MGNTATKKMNSNWFQRFAVKLKVKSPVGIKLTPKETEALADVQALDVKVLKDNQQEVLMALGATHIKDTAGAIKKASAARNTAVAVYNRTEDPIKKREWARRVVVSNEAYQSLTSMRDRMDATRERLEMIKGDVELQLLEAEARVAETQAYAKAGKQLRLVGEKLVEARTRAKQNSIEYRNLEVSMEGAEKLVKESEAAHLLAEADKIAGQTEESQ